MTRTEGMKRSGESSRTSSWNFVIYPVLLGYLVIVVYPMAWLLYTSLKTDREIFLAPFTLPDWADLQWINFSRAWTVGQFGDYFLNSAMLTILTVILSLLFAAMAAYALSRFRFFGARPPVLLLPGGIDGTVAAGHRAPLLPDEGPDAAQFPAGFAARLHRLRHALRHFHPGGFLQVAAVRTPRVLP